MQYSKIPSKEKQNRLSRDSSQKYDFSLLKRLNK